MSSTWKTRDLWTALLMIGVTVSAQWSRAAEVEILRLDTREAMRGGSFEAVTLDQLGGLGLAHGIDSLASIDEPYVFSATPFGDQVIVGTGNSGKVLQVGREGVTELFAAPQAEIFSVLADTRGTVFAGSSPRGSVWQVGKDEPFFESSEVYIWDLKEDSSGSLLIATGLEGRVYRVGRDRRGNVRGEPEVIETGDSHARALAILPGGDFLIGTAGRGLILRVDDRNRVSTVYDGVQPEVAAFAVAADGTAYAALLASEASLVDLSANGERNESSGDGGEPGVAVVVEDQTVFGTRTASYEGARSLVIEISPQGEVRELFGFDDETVYSLLWRRGELWIGTGLEGRLYRWSADSLVLERQLNELQIASLVAHDEGMSVVTTNAAGAYRLDDQTVELGRYTSQVLDTKNVSRFGSFRWWGSGSTEFSFRSGMSVEPDRTWSEWQAIEASRNEISLGSVADGRYFQWRGTLAKAADADGSRIEHAEFSFRQRNRAPQIDSLKVLEAGQIMVPSSFTATDNVFEPWAPNKEGIFTSLKAAPVNGDAHYKTLWKKGYRTLRWSAKDPNGDDLTFDLEVQVGSGGSWLPIVSDLDAAHYSFDASVLPDGQYRFRLTATDHDSDQPLSEQRVSAPITIDHSVPRLVAASSADGIITIELDDESSPIRSVEVSFDAAEWTPAEAADGLLDARRETVRVSAPEAGGLTLLRVTDAAFNVVTFDLSKALSQ